MGQNVIPTIYGQGNNKTAYVHTAKSLTAISMNS